ncbi:MAG: DMT family transporter [Alphaproteobacteria bacterium]|nr:DMT family transporter [Alphaproteobacteria bacterium]
MFSRLRDGAVIGVLCMVMASALLAVTTLFAKALGLDGMHPLQVSSGRFLFALLALGALVAVRPGLRPGWTGTRWSVHLMRSVCGWLGVSCMFAAVALMPLAEATAISFLSPIVTMILAVIVLRELFGWRKGVAASLSLAGAMVIIQPGSDAFQVAALVALAAACFMGAEGLFIKKLSDSEPPLRILLINNAIGASIALFAALWVWQAPSPQQWGLMAALGITMVIAQSFFIQSMKRAPATVVMPAFYMTLLFAAVYDILFFAIWPTETAWIGAAMIIAGALVVAFAGRKAA